MGSFMDTQVMPSTAPTFDQRRSSMSPPSVSPALPPLAALPELPELPALPALPALPPTRASVMETVVSPQPPIDPSVATRAETTRTEARCRLMTSEVRGYTHGARDEDAAQPRHSPAIVADGNRVQRPADGSVGGHAQRAGKCREGVDRSTRGQGSCIAPPVQNALLIGRSVSEPVRSQASAKSHSDA